VTTDREVETSGPASAHLRIRFAHALSRLYFVRTGVALIWVLLVSQVTRSAGDATSPGVLVAILLFLYPIIDAAATLVDIRTTPPESQTLFQRVNLVTSLFTAAAVLAVGHRSFGAALEVFGIWAILSGVIQLIVAVRRHTLISAQWSMVISGAGSIFAGITFLSWSGSLQDGMAVLVQYSTGGAIWYAVTAAWLMASAYKSAQTA